MKKRGIVFILLISIAVFGMAFYSYAANEPEEHVSMIPRTDDTYDIGSQEREFKDAYIDGVAYIDTLDLGGVQITTLPKVVPLPIMTFVVTDSDGAVIGPITASTAPGLESDNSLPALVWADGELSYAQVTFRVPSDYVSGGAFRLMADESDSTTPNQVDFNVWINSDGGTIDAAATNQTPVALTVDAGTPELVTLSTIATDFDALAAGNWVTLNLWRDNTANGTGDLEIYYVEFYYQ